jgi:hypothetical protein
MSTATDRHHGTQVREQKPWNEENCCSHRCVTGRKRFERLSVVKVMKSVDAIVREHFWLRSTKRELDPGGCGSSPVIATDKMEQLFQIDVYPIAWQRRKQCTVRLNAE